MMFFFIIIITETTLKRRLNRRNTSFMRNLNKRRNGRVTFQTRERCGLLPRCLVGKGEIGQTETGAVVLVKIAYRGSDNNHDNKLRRQSKQRQSISHDRF